MSVIVTITERSESGGNQAMIRKAFKGRKRAALQRLKTSIQRVIKIDLDATTEAEATGNTSHIVFPTNAALQQANGVLQRVNDALSR